MVKIARWSLLAASVTACSAGSADCLGNVENAPQRESVSGRRAETEPAPEAAAPRIAAIDLTPSRDDCAAIAAIAAEAQAELDSISSCVVNSAVSSRYCIAVGVVFPSGTDTARQVEFWLATWRTIISGAGLAEDVNVSIDCSEYPCVANVLGLSEEELREVVAKAPEFAAFLDRDRVILYGAPNYIRYANGPIDPPQPPPEPFRFGTITILPYGERDDSRMLYQRLRRRHDVLYDVLDDAGANPSVMEEAASGRLLALRRRDARNDNAGPRRCAEIEAEAEYLNRRLAEVNLCINQVRHYTYCLGTKSVMGFEDVGEDHQEAPFQALADAFFSGHGLVGDRVDVNCDEFPCIASFVEFVAPFGDIFEEAKEKEAAIGRVTVTFENQAGEAAEVRSFWSRHTRIRFLPREEAEEHKIFIPNCYNSPVMPLDPKPVCGMPFIETCYYVSVAIIPEMSPQRTQMLITRFERRAAERHATMHARLEASAAEQLDIERKRMTSGNSSPTRRE